MKTIAIIDDDIHIGDVLEQLLRREGYQVLRAYSGTEALYLLSQQRPDLVLLDLMLPGLSGEEVLPKIQSFPVIILSAKGAWRTRWNCSKRERWITSPSPSTPRSCWPALGCISAAPVGRRRARCSPWES